MAAGLLIATKAYCNSLIPGAFSGDTTGCPTRSEIETAGLHIKKGKVYETDQLVPQEYIERLDWEYTFTVSPSAVSIPASGGSRKFTITSYKKQYSTSSTGSNVYVEGSQTNVSFSSSNTGGGTWDPDTNTISYTANQAGDSNGTITWTQAESGKKATATHSQGSDYIKSYSIPTVTLSYSPDISASGIISSNPTVTYKQIATWESGKTTEITSGGILKFQVTEGAVKVDSSNGKATATSKGNVQSGRTEVGKIKVSVTLNEQTGSSSAISVYQEANSSVSEWGAWTVNCSATPITISAAGGTSTLSGTATRTGTKKWTSGSREPISSGPQTVTSFSIEGAPVEGFSLSGSTLQASPNQGGERSVTVFGTYEQVNSNKVKVTQSGDKIKTWGEVTLNVASSSPLIIPASGGSVTVQATATQAYTTESGKSGSQSISVTYEPRQTIEAVSKGTVKSEVTTVETVTIKAIGNEGKSAAPKQVVVQQAKNHYTDKNHGAWTPVPVVSANPTSIPGLGGQSTITFTPKTTRTYERHWDSGSKQNLSQDSNGAIELTRNPGSAFSLLGNTLKAGSNNTGSVRSADVTAKWAEANITKSVTVEQPVGTIYKTETTKVYTFAVNPNSVEIGYPGGSKTITVTSYYVEWTRKGTSEDGGAHWEWEKWVSSGKKVKVKPTANKDEEFITIGEVTNSTGEDYTVSVTVGANTEVAKKTGKVSLTQDQAGKYEGTDQPELASSLAKLDVNITQETQYCFVLIEMSDKAPYPGSPLRGIKLTFDRPTGSNLTVKVYLNYAGHSIRQFWFNVPKGVSTYESEQHDTISSKDDIILDQPWAVESETPGEDKNIYILVKDRDIDMFYDFGKFFDESAKQNKQFVMMNRRIVHPIRFEFNNTTGKESIGMTPNYFERSYVTFGNSTTTTDLNSTPVKVIKMEEFGLDFYNYQRKKGVIQETLKKIFINLNITNLNEITNGAGSYYLYDPWDYRVNNHRNAGGIILDNLQISYINLGHNERDFNYIYGSSPNDMLILEITSGSNRKKFDLDRIKQSLSIYTVSGGSIYYTTPTLGGITTGYSDIIKFSFGISKTLEDVDIKLSLYYK